MRENLFKGILLIQVVAYLLGLARFYFELFNGSQLSLMLITIITALTIFVCYLIYISSLIIISHNNLKNNLKFIIWANLFQIFDISVLGFSYYFNIGLIITPNIFYDSNNIDLIQLSLFLDYPNLMFRMGYDIANSIRIGLNIVPACIFILAYIDYKRCLREAKSIDDLG